MSFFKRHYRAIAYVILALAIAYGLNLNASSAANHLYQTQLASCHRGNLLRTESNRRIPSHIADRDVLRTFLAAARDARLANYRATGLRSDRKAAHQYRAFIHTLDVKVKFNKVKLVNCNAAIKRP